ncbi:MAG: DUF3016 domain-containing protein [Parashewanella sp.]
MKTLAIALFIIFLNGCAVAHNEKEVSSTTSSGAVTILWQHPDKFRDIEASNQLQTKFQQRIFDTLTKALNKSASKVLTQDQKLSLTVTDVDLAGEVRPTFGASPDDIRIVKDLYPPRINFSYVVTQDGNEIISGTEKLRDLGFLDRIHPALDRPFSYETSLLTTWVKRVLTPKIESAKTPRAYSSQ